MTAVVATDWVERLRSMVKIEEYSGCWIFQGYIETTGNGYGKWRGPGWDIGGWAHRNAWFIHHGPIPAHLEVDHLCYRPACVNVDHLELVTPEENKRRAAERRRTYRDAAPIEHGLKGWIRGCECRQCRDGRPFPLGDQGSRVSVESLTASTFSSQTVMSLPPVQPWMEDALCANHDEDFWTKGQPHRRGGAKLEAAREVCDACPAWADCFAFAYETQPTYGIWAGMAWTAIPKKPADDVAEQAA